MARRSRAALVARAAARRAPNAGHAWDAKSGWDSKEGRGRVRGGKFTSTARAQGAEMAAGAGPPGSEREPSGAGSQNTTSTPPAAQEVGSVAAKVAHSLRQAGVRSSPTQQEPMRAPAAVQPGQARCRLWRRMGHSKGRWYLPGYVVEITQVQVLPGLVGVMPMLFPTMTGDMGLPHVASWEPRVGSGVEECCPGGHGGGGG